MSGCWRSTVARSPRMLNASPRVAPTVHSQAPSLNQAIRADPEKRVRAHS